MRKYAREKSKIWKQQFCWWPALGNQNMRAKEVYLTIIVFINW